MYCTGLLYCPVHTGCPSVHLHCFFFNLAKAFDSVPHKLLLSTLSGINIPPHLLHWLSSYLLNRTQQTVVSGSNSLRSHVMSGVLYQHLWGGAS